MANIAKLSAKLTADSNGFVSPLKGAANSAERLAGNVTELGSAALKGSAKLLQQSEEAERGAGALDKHADAAEKTAKATAKAAKNSEYLEKAYGLLKGAIIGAVIALTTGFIAKAVDASVATLRFARSIGDTVAGVETLQQAIRDTGGDAEGAKSALLDLARAVQSARAGNVTLAATFEALGLSVEDLARMKPSDQFRAIAEEIAKIENPEKRAAVAVAIFGDKAGELLPILSQGAAGIDKAAEKAKQLGLALPDEKIAAMEKGNIAFENMKTAIQGVALNIAANLFPLLESLIHEFGSTEDAGMSVTEAVAKGMGVVAEVIGVAVDVVDVLRIAFYSARVVILASARAAVDGWVAVADIIQTVADKLGLAVDGLKDFIDYGKALSDEFGQGIKEQADNVKAVADNFGRGEDAAKRFAAALEKAKQHGDGVGKAFNELQNAGGAVAHATQNLELFKKAADIKKEVLSPFEQFTAKLQELDRMLGTTALTWDEYAKAVDGALRQLESANNLNKMGFSKAVQANTVEAYSTIVTANQQENMRARETPQERAARILKESKQIQEKQLEQSRRIADGIQNIKVARIAGQ